MLNLNIYLKRYFYLLGIQFSELEAKTFQSLAHRANGLWNLLAPVKFY